MMPCPPCCRRWGRRRYWRGRRRYYRYGRAYYDDGYGYDDSGGDGISITNVNG